MTVNVKICGITRLEDALCAVECEAFALGFIFYTKSPRNISVADAKEIISQLPASVKKVGVFVNEKTDQVMDIMDECGLDIAQLHGDETIKTVLDIGAGKVWKAVSLNKKSDIAKYVDFPAAAVLVDSQTRNRRGGTGKVCRWELAAKLAAKNRLILAGGLTPDNIVEAVNKVQPFALDLNSGLESAPGIKDHDKIKQAFKNLKGMQ